MLQKLIQSPLVSYEGRITRRQFYRYYFSLLFSAILAQSITSFTISWPLAWLASATSIFCTISIVFQVIKRLHDVGKSGYFTLLFLLPIINVYATYLTFLKKGLDDRIEKASKNLQTTYIKKPVVKKSTKLLAIILTVSIASGTFSSFAVKPAYAAEGVIEGIGQWFNTLGKGVGDFTGGVVNTVGKGIDQVKAIAKVDIPGVGVIDLTQFRGIESIISKLPSNIDVPIPFTSFSIKYDRTKTPGENIVNNIAPFASGVVGTLNPLKPGAAIARVIIAQAKPLFDEWVKPYIPAAIKNGAHSVKEFIKPLLTAVEDPIIKNFLLPVWEFIVGPIDDLAVDIVKLLAEEAITGVPIVNSPGAVRPQMIFSAPLENQRPVGVLDAIDKNGVATGWAADPDDPTRSLTVHLYLVASNWKSGSDWKSEIGTGIVANLPRPDVTAARGFAGNHGFSFVIPAQFRIAQSGYRFLLAYADDTNGKVSDRTRLDGSPKEFILGLSQSGELESVNSTGKITGWALNPNYTSLYHYDRPRVEFYLDGEYGKGGVYITSSDPYHTRNDLNLNGVDVMGGSKNAVGFEEFLDEKRFRDGKEHQLYAYAVQKNSLEKTLLPGSPKPFTMPTIAKITFKYGYHSAVARGSTIADIVIGIPNKEHKMEMLLDNKVVDMNAALHTYPTNLPKDITYSLIQGGGTDTTRSVPITLAIPMETSLGMHTGRVRTYDEAAGFIYDAPFSIDVIPYELLSLTTPDELTVEANTELTLTHIPPGANFIGSNATMVIEKLQISGELGAIKIIDYALSSGQGDTMKISYKLPLDASRIRKGHGPVTVELLVRPQRGASDTLMQAVQIWSTDYGRSFRGVTKTGKSPILRANCKSSLKPQISFVSRDQKDAWISINAENPFEFGSGSLYVQGKNFGCYEKLAVSISAKDGGLDLDLSPKKESVETYDGIVYKTGYATDDHKYFNFRIAETGWDGVFEKGSGIEIIPLDSWHIAHGTVEKLIINVTDEGGHRATSTLPLFSKYTLKVVPGEGAKELKPSGPMRIWWKGFAYGHKVRILIDGESIRNFLLEKGAVEIFLGRELNYIDELSVPSWITPGTHTLTFEDITDLGTKGKVKYTASTSFVVPAVKIISKPEDIKNKQESGVVIEKKLEKIQPDVIIEQKTFRQQVEEATTNKTQTEPTETTSCTAGSTYSYTFKQCMEDKPDKLSPYDGIPCPPAGSVPDYTTRGCILQ